MSFLRTKTINNWFFFRCRKKIIIFHILRFWKNSKFDHATSLNYLFYLVTLLGSSKKLELEGEIDLESNMGLDDNLDLDDEVNLDLDDESSGSKILQSTSKRVRMIFSVMASPNRIDILRILNSKGPLTYSELKSLAGFKSKKRVVNLHTI